MFTLTQEERKTFCFIFKEIIDFEHERGRIFIDYSDIEMISFINDELKYRWNSYDLLNAINWGNPEVIEVLVSNGCSLNEEFFRMVINLLDLRVMRWLMKNNCPQDLQIKTTMEFLIRMLEDETETD